MGDTMQQKPWVEIANDLRSEIQSGQRAPGERLPSGSEIMSRYGCARQTAQNAVDQLRAEGLVLSVAGRGWFVADRPPIIRLARNRLSRAEREAGRGAFTSDAAAGGWKPQVEVQIRREAATAGDAELLGIQTGDEVVVRDRTMYADHHVVQLAVSRFPSSIAAGTAIEETNTGPGGVYARLEDLGWNLTHYDEAVSARAPQPREAELMQTALGFPVLEVVRVAFSGSTPVEVNRMTLSSERYQLVYRIDAD